MRQLTAMVAHMGDLGGAAEVAASVAQIDDEGCGGNIDEEGGRTAVPAAARMRPVVKAIGTNVSDLVAVLCGTMKNANLFLNFGKQDDNNGENGFDADQSMDTVDLTKEGVDDGGGVEKSSLSSLSSKKHMTIDASQEAGGLGTLLLACSSNLPLQTPSYAALTLGVDVVAPSETHAGFAMRCVTLGLRLLGRDLDLALECISMSSSTTGGNASRDNNLDDGMAPGEREMMMSVEDKVALMKINENRRSHAELYGGARSGSRIDAYHRAKLTLRYFAHLCMIGIVTPDELVRLLVMLVECASKATTASSKCDGSDFVTLKSLARAGRLLASLVLSTIPYVMGAGDDDVRSQLADIVDAIDSNIVGEGSGYVSEYIPGTGIMSVLLKGELDDAPLTIAMVDENDDEGAEEEDEEEEEGDDKPAPCADTLQDLLRTVRKLVASYPSSDATRFALLDDAPWKALTMEVGGSDMEVEIISMTYKGEPLLLDLIGSDELRCISVPYLLSIERSNHGGTDENIEIRCGSLDGIVFGRLAIFDTYNEDGDDEEEGEEKKEANPNHDAYVQTYSLIDRFFLSDAVRDVLLCHRPMVSEAGADRNTVKEVAEQVWAVSHLFKPPPPSSCSVDMEGQASSKGIEYGIIETLLSLVVQTTPTNSSTPSASPLHSHIYLSRIILELTKLQPSLVPQAIVLAVSGMFNDFVPSLIPSARENLGHWFGFHLVNTGYQWPNAYWELWAPYAACAVTAGGNGKNSRGEFIKTSLHFMASLSSEGALSVVKECLPPGNDLVRSVLLLNESEEEEISSLERDLIHRMWNTFEEPDSIRQYLISDEVSVLNQSTVLVLENVDHKSVWWRARMTIRAVFHPARRDKLRMARVIHDAWKGNGSPYIDGMIHEDVDETEDLLADLSDAVPRFKPVILAALARDADAYDSISSRKLDDDELLLAGEVSILDELGSIIPHWDLAMTTALIECLTKSKIVSGMAVVKWALMGDIDSHWWKFVSLAIYNSISDACSSSVTAMMDLGGGIGMIVDDGRNDKNSAEAAALRLEEAIKSAVPLLRFVTESACQVLAACTTDEKVPLACADVADGMKRLLSATLFHLHSLVLLVPSSSDGVSGELSLSNIQTGLASMDADGKSLALLCQRALGSCKSEQGNVLLHSLSMALVTML